VSRVFEDDIVEAPSRRVWSAADYYRRFRFGTVGTGLDIARLMWPHSQHVFSSQSVDLMDPLVGRPTTLELGPPGRVSNTILWKNPLDALVVDADGSREWRRWFAKVADQWHRRASLDFLVDLAKEEKVDTFGMLLGKAGYALVYWIL